MSQYLWQKKTRFSCNSNLSQTSQFKEKSINIRVWLKKNKHTNYYLFIWGKSFDDN